MGECVYGDTECTLDEMEQLPSRVVPKLMFLHGVNDDVVNYRQTCEVVDSIRLVLEDPERCTERILEDVSHVDTALHLMMGGVTRDVLMGCFKDWSVIKGSS